MKQTHFPAVVVAVVAALLGGAALTGCDEEVAGGPTRSGDVGGRDDGGREPDSGRDDVTGDDVSADATDTSTDPPDVAPDTLPDTTDETSGPDTAPDAVDACDQDQDGFLAEACGGDDCDDTDRRVNIDANEACDAIDNDCDGTLNDGISCTFYAHTPDELYEIDPFNGTHQFITSVPGLLDFDTSPDGTLWGVTSSTLYRFDEVDRDWSSVGSVFGLSGVNGFAIDTGGNAYATGGNRLYAIDLTDGGSELIGTMGGFYSSSGDCVVDKSNILYMTSTGSLGDVLVRLDAATGAGTTIGDIGFSGVYGLTAAWGYLFGVTSSGQLIEIDPGTGEGTLVATFEPASDYVWWGAASTAGR